jgi:hypothetical protein
MSLTQFLDTEVLSTRKEFFGELDQTGKRPERRATQRISSIPSRVVLGAISVAALGVFPMSSGMAAATSARVYVGNTVQSGAAVEVPSLSPQQLRAVRLIRAVFEPIDPGLDVTGEGPDYGF